MDTKQELLELVRLGKQFTQNMEAVLFEQEKIMVDIHNSLKLLVASNIRMIQILREISNGGFDTCN